MERLLGKKSVEISPAELAERIGAFQRVEVDLGTGDGAYPYPPSGETPNTLFLGIDPARENLGEKAGRSLRKPARGGRPNLIYLIASFEQLHLERPECLRCVADRI